MTDDLRVDVAGAVAVAEAAASFDWTWAVSDIERFCVHMGWDEPMPSRHDDTLMWARTDLDVEDAVATFRFRGYRLDTVTLPVGDDGCGLGESGAAAFDEVTAALRAALGDPTDERISARRGPSWTFADLVVGVSHGAAIELMLVDPLDQDHWGQGDRWADAGARAATGAGAHFLEVVPGLVRADFGTWSRQEVETQLTRIGLLPFTKDDSHGRGWAGRLLVCVGDGELYRRYGHGDVHEISVIDAMDERLGDDAYRAAFDACRSSLGVPDLIGGGVELFAVWTGDDTTVRVSHSRSWRNWNRTVTLTVEVSPTEPTQNWLAHRVADWLEYTDGEPPEPSERWHLRPDAGRRLRPHIGFLTEPSWHAEDWEELDHNLETLFSSFVDGLLFHHEYVGELGWAIGVHDEPGAVVHGWFGAKASEVYTVEDGEVRTRAYLHERDTAKLVTETVSAALRACGATSPRDLWCDAWTPGQPGKLVAVRFGLDGDRPDPIERELDG